MRRFRSRVALAALVALLSGVSATVRAAPPGTDVVDVLLAGSDEDVAALGSAVTEALAAARLSVNVQRLARIDPRVVSQAPAAPGRASAPRLWVQRSTPDHATLYLTSADGSRVFVRDFSLDRGLDPVALELLGLVARSSISAMLAGDAWGVSREEYQRTLPKPAPTSSAAAPDAAAKPAPRLAVWHVGALYETELLAASVVEHGVGAQLEREFAFLSAGLTGQLRFPLTVGESPLQARLSSRSLRAFLALPLRVADATTLSPGAAFGVDWISVTGRAEVPEASAAPAFSVSESVARSFASLRTHFGSFELGVLLGVEFGLVKARYFVLRSGETETVFSPFRLRPLANLSLSARF